MNFKLKKADKNEIIISHALLVECGKNMYEKWGLRHWFPFMDLEIFQHAMKEKDIYIVYQQTDPIATFNVSTHSREYYVDHLWSNPNESAIYLGQLGIQPYLQGNGIGKWCMHQVEQIAREKKCKAIRFDALLIHPWLSLFYEKLGYRRCGIVKPAEWELVCFEKVME